MSTLQVRHFYDSCAVDCRELGEEYRPGPLADDPERVTCPGCKSRFQADSQRWARLDLAEFQ